MADDEFDIVDKVATIDDTCTSSDKYLKPVDIVEEQAKSQDEGDRWKNP